MDNRAEPTKGDDIFVVKEKSKLNKLHTKVEPAAIFAWEHFISNARVIPFPAELAKGSKTWLNKVRGRDAIRVTLRVDCGITLKHKGREWREETSVDIIIPFTEFQRMFLEGAKILKRHGRKRLQEVVGK